MSKHGQAKSAATPEPSAPSPADYHELRVWAEMFDDAQTQRIAQTNRVERGGVDPIHYLGYLEQLQRTEQQCELSLKRAYRRVAPPEVVAWQKDTLGIGEPTLALLLGHLGHPIQAYPKFWSKTPPADHVCDPKRCGDSRHLVEAEPFDRTISQLWAYCGVGDPSRKRRAGMSADDATALGKPRLKVILYNMALPVVKQLRSPYRAVYDARRVETAERVHADVCVRCGPSGRPAQPGSPWSKAHQMADALRIVEKEILRDLWLVAAGKQARFGGEVETIAETVTKELASPLPAVTKVRRQAIQLPESMGGAPVAGKPARRKKAA